MARYHTNQLLAIKGEDDMTAAEKFELVINHLRNRRPVYFVTYTRATKITPKYLPQIEEIVKVSGNSIYLRHGKHWDCADYCAIQAGE